MLTLLWCCSPHMFCHGSDLVVGDTHTEALSYTLPDSDQASEALKSGSLLGDDPHHDCIVFAAEPAGSQLHLAA